MEKIDLVNEIRRLKEEKNAIILAHNYQLPEVQDVADIVGDSLKLSQEAEKIDAEIIVLAGVKFMAETAKILSPKKKVLLPAKDAGCPMADMIDLDKLREFKSKHVGYPVVCYVNSSIEVKSESDVCCTSSNALKIVDALDSENVLFIPDRNLGDYISKQIPNKNIISYNGFCVTHNRITLEEVDNMLNLHKDALLLAHPECDPKVVEKAHFVGSTAAIIDFANKSENKKFIIATEIGVMHKLERDNMNTGKEFYLLSPSLVCSNMKKTKLEDIYKVLNEECNEISIDEDIRLKAKKTLDKMLELS